MNPWYQQLIAAAYQEHDTECEEGPDCPARAAHIKGHFIPQALRDRVETLAAAVDRVRELHRHASITTRGATTPDDRCTGCQQAWPCPTIQKIDVDLVE